MKSDVRSKSQVEFEMGLLNNDVSRFEGGLKGVFLENGESFSFQKT